MAYSFEYDTDDLAFRAEIRQFLADNLPPVMAERNRTAVHNSRADFLGWQAILHARGWSVPHWPVEHGGTGWSAKQRLIFEEECLIAGAPPPNSQAVFMLAPILHAFGSVAQQQRFLPAIREGTVLWSQGFSEPNAGSDLASLKTRAVRQDGGWVVNGQKIWTSLAHIADWIFLLVRTNTEVRAQAGISFMVVRADAPGVTIRPIRGIDGHLTLCETFYDNVHIPDDQVIGEIGRGWDYAKYLLANERISGADAPRTKLHLQRLQELAHTERRCGVPLARQHSFATQLAEFEIEVHALEITVLRALSDNIQSGAPISSMLKLCGTELVQKLAYAQVEAIGAYGAIAYPPSDGAQPITAVTVGPVHAANIANEALYRRSTTIYAGSSEIQRTIMAKALLGLDPARTGNSSGLMSGELSDSAQRYVARSYDFAARRIMLDDGAASLARNWGFFAEMGWLGAGLPEAAGGLGGNPFDTAALLEVLGGALVVEPYVAVAVLAAQAILHGATPEQCRTLLPPLIAGESLIVLAHEERGAGGRVEWIETRADTNSVGYELTGHKTLVLGAAMAQQLIVAARTGGGAADRDGISLFLVPADAAGLTRHKYRTADGRMAAEIVLDRVAVGEDALLGTPGAAFPALSLAVDHAIMATCAELLGAMTSAFWLTRDYLLTRHQFGTPLASFQALQHRLADLYLELEQARSMLYHGLARLGDEDAGARRKAVASAKWRINQAAEAVCGQAIQLHGGIGMTEDYAVGHYFKRLIVTNSQFGSARFHLDRVIDQQLA